MSERRTKLGRRKEGSERSSSSNEVATNCSRLTVNYAVAELSSVSVCELWWLAAQACVCVCASISFCIEQRVDSVVVHFVVVVAVASVVRRDRIKCNKDSSFEMQLNATAAAKPHETQLVKLHAQRTFVSRVRPRRGRHVDGPRNWPQCQIGARWLHNFIMTAKLRDSMTVPCPCVWHLVPSSCAPSCSRAWSLSGRPVDPQLVQDTVRFFASLRLISQTVNCT